MTSVVTERTGSNSRLTLLLIAALTVVAWQFAAGRWALYPFTILATYAHEMGHGLTACVLGASFDGLELFSDGSGLARWHGSLGRVASAMVALGGLVGPSIIGMLVLLLSRYRRWARVLLYGMAVSMLLSLLLLRTFFGLVFVGAASAALIFVARFGGEGLRAFMVQVVGVQLCLSVFRDLGYMFSAGGMVDGVFHASDSQAMADALLLPYWFWGAIAAVVAVSSIGLGIRFALAAPPDKAELT